MLKSISTLFSALLVLSLLTGCGGSNGPTDAAIHNTETLTAANFDEIVLASDKPVLVDFWATWCAPCRRIAPVVEEIAGEYKGKAVVGKLDFDQNKEVAARYQVQSLPTLLVFKDGKEFARIVGAQSKAAITSKLDLAISRSSTPATEKPL